MNFAKRTVVVSTVSTALMLTYLGSWSIFAIAVRLLTWSQVMKRGMHLHTFIMKVGKGMEVLEDED